MKKGFIGFWVLFIGYFIFIHPCIIYYNTPHSGNNTPDGMLALFFLASSFMLWGIVLGFTLYLILKNGIFAKRNLRFIDQNGKRVESIIRQSEILKEHPKGFVSRELTLEINNFSGEKILHKMMVNDSRPAENRFETGKIIYLRVDPEFKKNPYVFLEGSRSKINYGLWLAWLVFFAGVAAYYWYSYATENEGSGWRFLELFHPLLVIPACFIFFTGIIYLIVRIFILGNATDRELLQLKFQGVKTMAHITHVRQTGTYINQQPQVEYTLEFKDKKGNSVRAQKKEIVSLMDIGKVSSIKQREILYLPDNPEKFCFFDEFNN